MRHAMNLIASRAKLVRCSREGGGGGGGEGEGGGGGSGALHCTAS